MVSSARHRDGELARFATRAQTEPRSPREWWRPVRRVGPLGDDWRERARTDVQSGESTAGARATRGRRSQRREAITLPGSARAQAEAGRAPGAGRTRPPGVTVTRSAPAATIASRAASSPPSAPHHPTTIGEVRETRAQPLAEIPEMQGVAGARESADQNHGRRARFHDRDGLADQEIGRGHVQGEASGIEPVFQHLQGDLVRVLAGGQPENGGGWTEHRLGRSLRGVELLDELAGGVARRSAGPCR